MESELFINTVTALMGLLFIAAVSALILKRIGFPYTVGLVVIGIGLSFLADNFPGLSQGLETLKLSPLLIMFIFIPILIFESAFGTNVRLLLKNLVPTMTLAAPGLLLSTGLIGAIIHAFTPLPLGSALIFGCLISATDPVAVIALFKDVGAPQRLTILVEGESLFNDATAIVTFQIIMAVIATGILDAQTVLGGIGNFFVVFFGGLIIGLGFGHLLAKAIRIIGEEPLVHITLTLVVAYTAFIVSEHFLHTSGIMAVLGAGLVIGYYGPTLYSERVEEYLEVFWENAAFVANSLIFLMLGLSEKVFLTNVNANMSGLFVPVVIAIIAVLLVRALIVFGFVPVINRLPGQKEVDSRYQTVMYWGGLRGAVAVALAMSLPTTFPYRWQIIDLAFGVTFFTLLVNGTTMSWLIRTLKLDQPTPLADYCRSFVKVLAKKEALIRLDTFAKSNIVNDSVLETTHRRNEDELQQAENHLQQLCKELQHQPSVRRKLLWIQAIGIQTRSLREQYEEGLLSLQALRDLEWDLREQEFSIEEEKEAVNRVALPECITAPQASSIGFVNVLLAGGRKKLLEREYEKTAAMLTASQEVLGEQEHLREFSKADKMHLGYLVKYYQTLSSKAAGRLTSLEKELAEAGRNAQQRRLEKLTRDGERTVLHIHGIADAHSEFLAERLEQEMEAGNTTA